MGRMLVAGAALAAMLAISPACDKKPRITAQPLAEKTMMEKAAADSIRVKTAPWIDSLLAKVPTKQSDITKETAGSRRIMIELENTPKQAAAYARRYNELVSDVSYILRHEYRGFLWKHLCRLDANVLDGLLDLLGRKAQMDEEKFITGINSIMHFKKHWGCDTNGYIEDYIGYMSESIKTGKFECTTSSFVVFDVAKELHIKMEMVVVWMHQLVKTQNFFFEILVGEYYPLKKVHDHYPIIEAITSDPEKILFMAYEKRGASYCNRWKLWRAVKDFNKAIDLLPCATCYCCRGDAYEKLGKTWLALRDYDKAIKMDSLAADLYYLRGKCYYNLCCYSDLLGNQLDVYYRKLRRAVKDFSKAIKLEPRDPDYYLSRSRAYFLLDMEKEADADRAKAKALTAGDAQPE